MVDWLMARAKLTASSGRMQSLGAAGVLAPAGPERARHYSGAPTVRQGSDIIDHRAVGGDSRPTQRPGTGKPPSHNRSLPTNAQYSRSAPEAVRSPAADRAG